jgi:hypothetical protein
VETETDVLSFDQTCIVLGEIIQLSEPMTMMFEPEDLAVASPGQIPTHVLRCILFDIHVVSW